MARFCIQCGQALKEGVAFCGNCGQPVQGAPAPQAMAFPPQAAPPQQTWGAAPPTAKPGGSPVMKILLICLAIFMLFGMVVLGGIFYAGYKVKQKVEQAAAENGINLKDLSGAAAKGKRVADPCVLMTREEASQILGTEIIRTETAGEMCQYFQAAVSPEQRGQGLQAELDKLEKSGEKEKLAHLEQVMKSITSGAADPSTPLLTVTISEDGNQKLAAMRIALGVGGAKPTRIPELGDDSVIAPLDSMLVVVKDGTGIEIDLRLVKNGRDKGIAIAKQVMSRL